MRLWQIGWLVVPIVLVGCGGSTPTATLSVTCGEDVVLAGARSIDVLGDQVNGRTIMSFPDPVNRGKSNALSVRPGDRCSITPVTSAGG